MKEIIVSALKWLAAKTSGYKTATAVVGLIGLAVSQFANDNFDGAATSLLTALAFTGIRFQKGTP